MRHRRYRNHIVNGALDTNLMEGDLNLDGFVGQDDLDIVLSAWNQNMTAGVWGTGDPTGDGFAGLDDLTRY